MDFIKLQNSYVEYHGKRVELVGFVKSNRVSSKLGFLIINDGTCLNNIQVVYKFDLNNIELIKQLKIYSTVKVSGIIKLTPNAQQPFEIAADNIEILKDNVEDYPLQKKEHSFEFLRDIAHLRPRTNTFWSVMKVRSVLSSLIHNFFNERGFVWVSSPIITSNDGEGAGETFFVNTNDKERFFNQDVCLSVTGQLQAEAYAQAFKKVYSFGPTFRAEKSHTARHAAEFWMLEPEIAFANLNDIINLMQEMIVYLANNYLKLCSNEFKFFCSLDPELETKIKNLTNAEFKQITYTNVIEKLNAAVKNNVKFEDNNIYWGMDLGSEHEKYICEKVFNCPVFVTDYPKEIKAFYMKQNSDNKTVAAVDLLIPGIGELIGGSQREDDYNKLISRCNELKMDLSPLQWYLDLRKYGYYMSSGFGLGFERLIMFFTGINNIRDVIPFPRTHGQIKF